MKILIGVLVALALLPSPAHAERIAVLEFSSDGSVADDQLVFLADMVRAAARVALDTDEWMVITRESMLVVLESNVGDLEACVGECEVETGRLIGADLIIAGGLVKFGEDFRLMLKLYETKDGNLLRTETVKAGNLSDLADAVEGVGKKKRIPGTALLAPRS